MTVFIMLSDSTIHAELYKDFAAMHKTAEKGKNNNQYQDRVIRNRILSVKGKANITNHKR